MPATIYDIAKKCHCSTTTVSKVLNNVGSISHEKKIEILKTAEELGYVRSQSARSLASANKSTHLIGIILHINEDKSITHELFSSILNHFRIEMEKEDYDICFLKSLNDSDSCSYETLVRSRGIDGVFILSASIERKKIVELLNSNIPTVSFDIPLAEYEVSSDNTNSVASLVDYLVKLGHKRICYVAPRDFGVAKERYDGFLLGLKRNNIPFDERMIVNAPFYCLTAAKEATDKAFASGINPTAIMYPDDYTAISAIPYLRTLGYKVPSDISITGFDGVEIGSVMRPSITTIKQNSKQIGITAAKMLLKRINNEVVDSKTVVIETTICEGESTRQIE